MDFNPGFHFAWPVMMMIVGTLLSILFWVTVLAFGIWAVRRFTERPAVASGPLGGDPSGSPDSAIRILQERLARGEINAEEYESIKRTLET